MTSVQVCQQLLSQLRTAAEAESSDEVEERINVGVNVLSPALDINTEKTSELLPASLQPEQLLWTLTSIPWDLLGFYQAITLLGHTYLK